MMNIPVVMRYLRPNSGWSLDGDSYEGLKMLDGSTLPTLQELEEAWPLAEAEHLSSQKRSTRNKLLSNSDYRMVTDAPWDTTAWATYRQQLRDLPSDPAWPYVDFPNPPESN